MTETIELPSKHIWRAIRRSKQRKIRHLKVTAGGETPVIDTPLAFNLRLIPGVFTAPLQAVGLVTSIFARMLNIRITLDLNSDHR